jgi:hypothetical protein
LQLLLYNLIDNRHQPNQYMPNFWLHLLPKHFYNSQLR